MIKAVVIGLALFNLGCYHSSQGGIISPVTAKISPSPIIIAEERPEISATTITQESPSVIKKKYKSIQYSFDEGDSLLHLSARRDVFEDAVAQWNHDLGMEIFSSKKGRIKLMVLFLDIKGESGDNGVVAATTLRTTCSKQVITVYKNASMKRRVILHELGHSMGLGHSDNIDDIMYYRATSQQYPSKDDIKRAKLAIERFCN